MTWSCRDCPAGNVITDHVYRVQRRVKHHDQEGRLVAVDTSDEWDIYCKEHHDRRRGADAL